MTVLVMGARGSVGRHVLSGLLDLGVPVRASARRPDPAAFPAGVAVVAADLTEPASLAPAFDGADQVFLYAEPAGVAGVIAAARAAGVRRIVLLSSGSVLLPTAAGNPITEEHRAVEAAFAASGLDVRPVRPLVLAGNARAWAGSIRDTRTARIYRPEALTAPVHERDVAAVVVAALTTDVDTGGLLTGPVRSTQRAQAGAIGAALGEPVAVRELTGADALDRFGPDARAILSFIDDSAAGNSPATTAVAGVLGRPALDFTAWAAEHVADFR
jgi:uncharacterized protein YbjT (DUF2867 family)